MEGRLHPASSNLKEGSSKLGGQVLPFRKAEQSCPVLTASERELQAMVLANLRPNQKRKLRQGPDP